MDLYDENGTKRYSSIIKGSTENINVWDPSGEPFYRSSTSNGEKLIHTTHYKVDEDKIHMDLYRNGILEIEILFSPHSREVLSFQWHDSYFQQDRLIQPKIIWFNGFFYPNNVELLRLIN